MRAHSPHPIAARIRLLALPAAVAIAAVAAGCGDTGPTNVTIAQLADHRESYSDRQVETRGTVRRKLDPDGTRRYVLTDNRGNLVALQPRAPAARHRGERVSVTGSFVLDPHVGRLIRIQQMRRLPP